MTDAPKKKKIIKAAVICIALLAVLTLLISAVGSVIMYELSYDRRFYTQPFRIREMGEFPGLETEKFTFEGDRGQTLSGCKYFHSDSDIKGIMVIAHGLGSGGHNVYMDVANWFAERGYIVFAYDATGNDESDGESLGGLIQGVIDLDYALRYVKSDNDAEGLPIVLFGHSWGAYSACCVLKYHPDVKAVVSVAGFDTSVELFETEGRDVIGNAVYLLKPFAAMLEKIRFGEYADISAIKGFEASSADIMVLHSADDTAVPEEYGYDKYFEKYSGDSRFTFAFFENRGHSGIYYTDKARAYRDELEDEYDKYLEENGLERTPEIRSDFMLSHMDKTRRWELDEEILSQMLDFYGRSISE